MRATFSCPFTESREPLSLAEIIALFDQTTIDGAGDMGLVKPHIVYLLECGESRDKADRFVRVESAFYPELTAHYEKATAGWVNDFGENVRL